MFAFLEILEIALVIAILWFFVTQICAPIIRGTVIMPIFRKEAKLEKELAETNQEVVEKKLEDEIKNLKQKEGVN